MLQRSIEMKEVISFSDMSMIPLTGVKGDQQIWGDYESDGDLDILVPVEISNLIGVSKIYRNNNILSNTTPSTPSNPISVVNADSR